MKGAQCSDSWLKHLGLGFGTDDVERSKSPYLGLLLLCGVHDGGAADLGQLAALAVERPAADLVADHVLDEEDAAVEAERQLVEELDVLQQVVVRVTEESREVMKKKKCCIVHAALWPLAHDFILNYLVICRRKKSIICVMKVAAAAGGTFSTWCRSTCYCFCCTPTSPRAEDEKQQKF